MSPRDALSHFKKKAAIGAAAGVDRQVVHGWFQRNRIPLDHQIRLELATRGALRADVEAGFRRRAAAGVA